jgi:hypothetical protein
MPDLVHLAARAMAFEAVKHRLLRRPQIQNPVAAESLIIRSRDQHEPRWDL